MFRLEAAAANLLQQVRWHVGLYCPHCHSEPVINYGSYRLFHRYQCKDCGRTFYDKTDTNFAHAHIGLGTLRFAFYSLLRFNTSIRQFDVKIDVPYRSLRSASSSSLERPTQQCRHSRPSPMLAKVIGRISRPVLDSLAQIHERRELSMLLGVLSHRIR